MHSKLLDRVALVVVVASLAAVSAPIVARSHVVEASTPVEALLIGDSVLNGLAQPYSAAGRAALAARHSFIIDSAGCRRLITTSCRIPPGSAPTNAITVARARAGQYDRALVIAAGYDDPSSGEFGIGAAVDVMIAEARRQGIDHVIWLTYREAGGPGHAARFRESNAVLRGRHDPELILADWATLSADMPSSWFSADGIHLGPHAAAAMGELIGDTLDLLPVRCTTGVWTGTDVPGGATEGDTPTDGGINLMPTPVRVVDTRELAGKLGAGKMLTVPIAGANGVPADATAAVVSVTAVEPCGDTFLTVWPCGNALPTASMVNAPARSIVANSAVVRLGGGSLCVYSMRPTDVIVDLSGWIALTGLRSLPVAPVRVIDTRVGEPQALNTAQNRLGAKRLLAVGVAALPGFDATATAATVNVTAVAPDSAGFLSVLPGPCSTATLPPSTSNLNVTADRVVAASATVGLGDGELCIYTSTVTDVVVDLQALHGSVGGRVSTVQPRRLIDTRDTTRLAAGQSLPIGLGTSASAAIVNLTAVDPADRGFLALYPCGGSIPTVSNLNVVAHAVVANRAMVSTAGSSQFCLFTNVETDVVVDLEAIMTPS